MKKVFKIMTCVILMLTLTGCGDNKEPDNKDDNVISFNESELNITVNDLYNALKTRYATNYIIQTIDEKILDKEYETDDDTNSYVESQMKIYRLQYNNDEQAFLEALQNAGYQSVSEFEGVIRSNYKRNLLTKDYIRKNISDSDIEKYYNDNYYGDITISHILIKLDTTSDATSEEIQEAETKATEKISNIYKKLEEGTEFSEVAKEYSDDTATASKGGLLGTYNKDEMTKKYNKEFEEAVINLKVNSYNKKVVKSSYGYHIIFKNAEKEKPAIETIKQNIIDILINDKMQEDTKSQYKALIELRDKYGFTINDEEIKTQYDNAVNNWLYSKD